MFVISNSNNSPFLFYFVLFRVSVKMYDMICLKISICYRSM